MKQKFYFLLVMVLAILLTACSSKQPVDEGVVVTPFIEPQQEIQEKPQPTITTNTAIKAEELGSVYFLYDRVFIPYKYRAVVEAHAKYMQQNPKIKLVLEGNTDKGGKSAVHHKIGFMRAEEVKKRLVAFGVSSKRITISTYGSNNPVALGSTTEDWRKNRRVDFIYSD